MLINMFTADDDYVKSLKIRRLAFLGMLMVGLVGMACYALLVKDSGLPDFFRGFYCGAGGGLSGVAAVFLFRVQYLLKHPEKQREARIKETDERAKANMSKAVFFAGMVTFFASAAALFVLLPINIGAFWALFGVIMIFTVMFFGATVWLDKRG